MSKRPEKPKVVAKPQTECSCSNPLSGVKIQIGPTTGPAGRYMPPLDFSASSSASGNKNGGANAVYQFKISMINIKPKVWRRILVPKSISFHELHWIIQKAFSWENRHVYEFRFGPSENQIRITLPDEELWNYNDAMWNSMYKLKDKPLVGAQVKMQKFFKEEGDKGLYEYDLGDKWYHKIELEKILSFEPGTSYPRCTAGKRLAPPEDCGGVYGYEKLLAGLDKPYEECDEEEKEKVDWINEKYPGYEPDDFQPGHIFFKEPFPGKLPFKESYQF